MQALGGSEFTYNQYGSNRIRAEQQEECDHFHGKSSWPDLCSRSRSDELWTPMLEAKQLTVKMMTPTSNMLCCGNRFSLPTYCFSLRKPYLLDDDPSDVPAGTGM
jgi:hypothetical protein